MIKKALLLAADSKRLERIIGRSRLTKPLVSRYVAGTTLDEAVAATRELNAKGIDVSLDLLGETVSDLRESADATAAYVDTMHALATGSPDSTVSVKLSQLGIGLDPVVCVGHLKQLLDVGAESGISVEVDMEHSSVGPQTLEAFRSQLPSHPNTRVAIQAAMRRTPEDLCSFSDVKPRIRLVKGAFLETIDKAIVDPAEVTAQYQHLAGWALQNLPDPAFGTHDDSCVELVKATAARLGISKRDFEFQMLYGVRRELQEQLAADGYRVRVYVPFGSRWYPYLMRRMAERPANLMLFLRSVVGD
ncbi:proline dehydrogenase [Gordonia sp. HNM0687]|uniref:proline dehydrogenase n=1 Tax=Gordonia mangrovi TaxID=2665643 RepID=A0A6L7GIV5_9ACTN|nr:proline dehydrogenase family protein [Gordonia mangrovi]MXP19794.1 proline dehydrogenase [Gordonia mangrovi]UVF79579.1 proline dehydrogenase family protein [Gordonia mangrovi]